MGKGKKGKKEIMEAKKKVKGIKRRKHENVRQRNSHKKINT